jgi:hypothetical protein
MPAGVSAYTSLANVTLGSSATTVTFSSISQAYRDLVLIVDGNSTSTTGFFFRVNADTGSNYAFVSMQGNGSGADSGSSASQTRILNYWSSGSTSSASRNLWTINFMDYSATDKHKSGLTRSDFPADITEAKAFRWANTAAITSILISTASGSLAANTTFALYGIAA